MDVQHIALLVASGASLAYLVWRFRFSPGHSDADVGLSKQERATLDAKANAEPTPAGRARVFADAADSFSGSIGRKRVAGPLYLRAMKADPTSVELVERTAAGLARRPRNLEAVLWRRLAASPWSDDTRVATLAALDHLSRLYQGPLHDSLRARALDHARKALMASEATSSSAGHADGTARANP